MDGPNGTPVAPPGLAELRRAFAARPLDCATLPEDRRCAAVAMIFCDGSRGLHLCVGKRASYDGDPWSGHMAFPGGKAMAGDRSFHDIARREALEETGIELGDRHLLGCLEGMSPYGRDDRPAMMVTPLVYVLDRCPEGFALDHELVDAFWVPLAHLWDAGNWTSLVYPLNNRTYPGIRYGDDIIWGFTLRVLVEVSELVGRPLADRMW